MPLVSVVIPTFNQAAYLHDTLLSIYAQTFTDYEIIVVDDGSTDNTRDMLSAHSHRVAYVYQPNSGGCSQPRNRGIASARGKYVSIFDSDDLMLPTKLARQTAFLEANPDVDFVFTDFVNFQGSAFHAPHTHTCTAFRSRLTKRVAPAAFIVPSHDAYRVLIDENFVGASSMFFRRALVDEVGGFDEGLHSSEDLDFCFRVAATHDIGFIDEVCHHRRLHSGNMTTNILKMYSNSIQAYSKQLASLSEPSTHRALARRIADMYCGLSYFHRTRKDKRAAVSALRAGVRVYPAYPKLYREMLKVLVLMAALR